MRRALPRLVVLIEPSQHSEVFLDLSSMNVIDALTRTESHVNAMENW